MLNGFTMLDILRDASLGQLPQRDAQRLRDYQTLLTMRVDDKRLVLANASYLTTTERATLTDDVRWYEAIQDEIGRILTHVYYARRNAGGSHLNAV